MAEDTFTTADINRAVNEGILTPQDGAAFESFLTNRATDQFVGGTVDGETPRLIRGFHDILISMGLIIGAIGIGIGLGGTIALMALAVISFLLAFPLSTRMRLALPSTILAIIFTGTAGFLSYSLGQGLFDITGLDLLNIWALVGAFGAAALAAGIFYLAFGVPIALAIVILNIGAAVGTLLLEFAGQAAQTVNLVGLAVTGVLYIVALRFDMSDPERRTTRSDVAFWIHLVIAPVLMANLMGLLFGTVGMFDWDGVMTNSDYLFMLIVLGLLAILAIALDRRALLVAGLGYLGVAIYSLLDSGGAAQEAGLFSLTLIAVSVVIVSLGLGWNHARRLVLSFIPPAGRRRLPPVRG